MTLHHLLACTAVCLAITPASASHADTSEEFAIDAAGVWTNADQSRLPEYDFILSEFTRLDMPGEDGLWLLQQNWILAEADPSGIPSRQGQQPYFQIAIQLRDFGDGALNSSTFRLTQDGKVAALGISPGDDVGFDHSWIGPLVCMGQVQRLADGYWDGTANCPNTYKGSIRVESRSLRTPDTYVNWDRGFDSSGKHIWGPASGGYIFKRRSSVP